MAETEKMQTTEKMVRKYRDLVNQDMDPSDMESFIRHQKEIEELGRKIIEKTSK